MDMDARGGISSISEREARDSRVSRGGGYGRRMFACEYPGRSCATNPSGTYTSARSCTERCVARAPRVTSSSVVYGRDVPLLAAMVYAYSQHSTGSWLTMSPETGSIVAAVDIPKGKCFLTAPAAIVDGTPTRFLDVLVTLPRLLRTVEGLTQLPQVDGGVVSRSLAKEWQDLVPIDAIVLADAVQRNAVLLQNLAPAPAPASAPPPLATLRSLFSLSKKGQQPGPLPAPPPASKYAVSVLFSLLPHSCDGNATAVVGTYPVHTLRDGQAGEGYTELSLQPAVAVYAFEDIKAGEAVLVEYGNCGSTSASGFACSRRMPSDDECSGGRKGPTSLDALMNLAVPKTNHARFYNERTANVAQPDIDTEDELVTAVRNTINAVQVETPDISYTDAQAIVKMWRENRSYER